MRTGLGVKTDSDIAVLLSGQLVKPIFPGTAASTCHSFAHASRRMTSVFDRRRSMLPIVEGGRPIQ
jgi:hypothetical protein